MKNRQITAHMKAAKVYADLSYCNRRKVGCVIVKADRIISIGYNGTPPGEDNTCEDSNGITKPNVIHAEDNALRKLSREADASNGNISECDTPSGATLFVTTAPCESCARLIIKAGIKKVFYSVAKTVNGISLLISNGIAVEQLPQ